MSPRCNDAEDRRDQNHKLFVNVELTPPDDHNDPDMRLSKAILAKYGQSVAGGAGSLSKMGHPLGKLVGALQEIPGPHTTKSVNAAIKGVKDERTHLLCQRSAPDPQLAAYRMVAGTAPTTPPRTSRATDRMTAASCARFE